MIICLICGKKFREITHGHLKYKHNITLKEYKELFPGASLVSEEFRKKESESHKGKKQTEESNRKRSETLKGHRPWNKGKHHTKESKEKMSISLKDAFAKPEYKEKNLKMRQDPKFREKQSNSMKIYYENEVNLEKHRETQRSPEARNNKSKAIKENWKFEEVRKRHSEGAIKAFSNPEVIERLSKGIKLAKNTPEFKAAQSKRSTEQWKDEEYIKKVMEVINKNPNKKEKQLQEILNQIFPNEYAYNGNFECGFTLMGKIPDFVNVNGQKKVIELYGDYWHRNDNPQDRIDLFEELGYECIVIWEAELEDKEKLITKLLEFQIKRMFE